MNGGPNDKLSFLPSFAWCIDESILQLLKSSIHCRSAPRLIRKCDVYFDKFWNCWKPIFITLHARQVLSQSFLAVLRTQLWNGWQDLVKRRSFAELSVSAFASLYSTLVRYEGLLAEPCCRRQLFEANQAVGDEARKGFPPTAIWGTTMLAGSALITQASPPWRPHSRIQNVSWKIVSRPQSLFYSASAA